MKALIILGILLISSTVIRAQGEYKPVVPFFKEYCIKCHGPDKQKGKIRLDLVDKIDAELWIDIHEQMKTGEMPPEDEKQPPKELSEEITKLVDTISRDQRFTVATGYRRLNKREYHNTVRDLLGLSDEFFDPARYIFDDEVEDGFDTNSENLIITNELLLEYLKSASISLKAALFTDETDKPVTKTITFASKQLTVQGQLSGKSKDYVVQRQSKGGIFPTNYASVIPATGKYRITATAAGVDRNKLQPKAGTPFRMSLFASFAGTTKLLHEFKIKDDKFEPYSIVVSLEKGAQPYFQGANISGKPRNINRRRKEGDKLSIPGLAIKNITIEGPIDVVWPPVTYQTTFQSKEIPDFENSRVRSTILRNFISRAFRRQVSASELNRYTKYLEAQYKENNSWMESYIRTFAAIMASTDFLYIKEELGELKPFQLANRLSYFLWSSMPDMELFSLANSGQLLNPGIYQQQLVRMIQDPKADAFIEGFAEQWLSIDELGTMRPAEDDKKYGIYFKNNLEEAMRQETLAFFTHILLQNQPVTDFLDSDYTFVNKALADLYGIPFNGGKEIQRVTLPKGSIRGGLLGQASIHAITSNGVETLPVTRGHWVLDELMGTPPPPPPEEVPAIVPDLKFANTPRDLLKKHREDPKCFACHKVMDPAGLALESFDIIGRYRTSYGGKSKIDPSGTYKGIKFENVRGLKEALMTQKDTFTYNLIVKIVEYAKGRKLNRLDHDEVKKIALKAKAHDYKFLYIMGDILSSDLMLSR